eukprot:COSAG01_NODE_1848_length_9066_cov_6.023754_13_plen_67_part_01
MVPLRRRRRPRLVPQHELAQGIKAFVAAQGDYVLIIRFGPKILLKCSVRKTGPKFRTTGLTTGINLR